MLTTLILNHQEETRFSKQSLLFSIIFDIIVCTIALIRSSIIFPVVTFSRRITKVARLLLEHGADVNVADCR
jgi:hypothetical protein